MMMMEEGHEEERRGDAGDRLFKTRTQHHRMVGKNGFQVVAKLVW